MSRCHYIKACLRRLRGENGIAMPVTVMLLMAVSTLGFVALKEVVSSEDQTRVDRGVKRAVATADAGFDTALYRLNKLRPLPAQCVVVNGDGTLGTVGAGSDGWCPAVQEDLGDGARFTYRATKADSITANGQSLLQRKIVSTGFVNIGGTREVVRRTKSVVAANTGNPLVGNYAVISTDPTVFDLKNSARINGDLGTNASVTLSNYSRVCGDIVYGQRKPTPTIAPQAGQGGIACAGYNYGNTQTAATQNFVLGPVEQGNVPPPPVGTNNNSNASIADQYWLEGNRNTRSLEIKGGQNLMLSGNDYSFCHIGLKGGHITIGARLPTQPPVRIYIDKPENCMTALPGGPGSDNANRRGNFLMQTTSEIRNLNADPATLILFLTGSPNIGTEARFEQQATSQVAMIVYGPYSTCILTNNARIRGAVACRKVEMSQTAEVSWDPLVGALTMTDIVPLYRRSSWVECDKNLNPSPPDANCA